MAPPRDSRKGKKAWRKNIEVAEVEEHIEATSLQERRGPATNTLQDSELFYVDKSVTDAAANTTVLASGARKKRRLEPKLLRSQLIIQAAHHATPVPYPARGVRDPHAAAALAADAAARKAATKAYKNALRKTPPPTFKLKISRNEQAQAGTIAPLDIWGDEGNIIDEALGAAPAGGIAPSRKQPKRPQPAPISAVEVDAAGCSYNPDREAHQDALAELVAYEVKRNIKKQLEPTAPPPTTMSLAPGEDELDGLQVEAQEDEGPAADDGAPITRGSAAAKVNKKTTKDRNKEKRRNNAERMLDEQQRLKRQRRELEALAQLQQGVAEELKEQADRRARREAVKAEKAAIQPPRLGKARFEPTSVQVLTTDEITGSLRQLKPCAMVATERFNSLQKRGLIEPRKPQGNRTPRRMLAFEKGARPERVAELQAEIAAMQRNRKMASRKLDRLGAPDPTLQPM